MYAKNQKLEVNFKKVSSNTPSVYRVDPKSPLCAAHCGDFNISKFRVLQKKVLKSTGGFWFFLKSSLCTFFLKLNTTHETTIER